MPETKHYLFRTTTAQLQGHLDHIEESGDRILAVQFMGGENRWVIVCRKGREPQDDRLRTEVRHLRAELRDLAVSAKKYMQAVDVARGVVR